jgi:hypothetical protein
MRAFGGPVRMPVCSDKLKASEFIELGVEVLQLGGKLMLHLLSSDARGCAQ